MKKIPIKGVIIPNDYKPAYDYLAITAVSPNDVKLALEQAGGEPVVVEINSPGGEVSSGTEIAAALHAYAGELESHIVGEACSAATLPAVARRCLMAVSARLMIHTVRTSISGDHRAMEQGAQALRSADKGFAAAYAAKSGKSEEEVLAMMDRTTWLSAQEAVAFGLVDGILMDEHRLSASDSVMLPEQTVVRVREILEERERTQALAEYTLLELGGYRI